MADTQRAGLDTLRPLASRAVVGSGSGGDVPQGSPRRAGGKVRAILRVVQDAARAHPEEKHG